jgi:hypothetical protein
LDAYTQRIAKLNAKRLALVAELELVAE